jgi:hypothetical protein
MIVPTLLINIHAIIIIIHYVHGHTVQVVDVAVHLVHHLAMEVIIHHVQV